MDKNLIYNYIFITKIAGLLEENKDRFSNGVFGELNKSAIQLFNHAKKSGLFKGALKGNLYKYCSQATIDDWLDKIVATTGIEKAIWTGKQLIYPEIVFTKKGINHNPFTSIDLVTNPDKENPEAESFLYNLLWTEDGKTLIDNPDKLMRMYRSGVYKLDTLLLLTLVEIWKTETFGCYLPSRHYNLWKPFLNKCGYPKYVKTGSEFRHFIHLILIENQQ